VRTPVRPHYKHADEESKGWRDGPHLLVRSHYTLPTMSSPEGPSGNDPSQSVRAIARRAARRAMAQAPVGQTPAGSASTERVSLPGAVALESMGQPGAASQGSAPGESAERELVGEGLVRAAAEGSELVIPPRARITPMARDLAFQKGVTFVTGRSAEPLAPVASVARRPARIAVASDHGGHDLKSQLIPLLKEMGERPVDLGPDTAAVSVDYPDFASLVAREVSEGRVDLGIIVDGAGIGSAMVANKVPGVLAANCWNAASARNAREHNHANVLTLGSGHLDLSAAREVLVAFLSTAEGEGRHARRNDKTLQVEAAHLRTRQLARTFDEGRG
jgi:ribose 5-phosphate isomerase B